LRKPVSCIAVIVCLVLVLTFAGGCSEPEEENTFIELLRLLPAEAKEERVIAIIDYEAIRKISGISLYDEDRKKITTEEYFDAVINSDKAGVLFGDDIFRYGSDWTGINDYQLLPLIQDSNIGYNITDVSAEINNISSMTILAPGISGFHYNLDALITTVGDFDAKSTKDALENRSEWPSWAVDDFKSEEYEKTAIYSWGNGPEFHLGYRYEPPHLDKLGRAVPLAVFDGQLFIGSSTEDIKSAIDSSLNNAPSLAEIPEYVLVAQIMHDLNTVGLLVMDEVILRDTLESTEWGYGPQLEDFTTVGMGLGKDDSGKYMALVIVFKDPVAAENGFLALEQKVEIYNEIYDINDNINDFDIYDMEISIDNSVVSAKLYTDSKALWRYWFINRWPAGGGYE
jgi:hypothetical protein